MPKAVQKISLLVVSGWVYKFLIPKGSFCVINTITSGINRVLWHMWRRIKSPLGLGFFSVFAVKCLWFPVFTGFLAFSQVPIGIALSNSISKKVNGIHKSNLDPPSFQTEWKHYWRDVLAQCYSKQPNSTNLLLDWQKFTWETTFTILREIDWNMIYSYSTLDHADIYCVWRY